MLSGKGSIKCYVKQSLVFWLVIFITEVLILKEVTANDNNSHTRKKAPKNVVLFAQELADFISKMPCKQKNCSDFMFEWKRSESEIVQILTHLDRNKIANKVNIHLENNQKNFEYISEEIHKMLAKNRKVSFELIKTAVVRAAETRPETINIDYFKVFPELTASTLELKFDNNSNDYQAGGQVVLLPLKYRVNEPENKLDYFREDDQVHWFHRNWHRKSWRNYPNGLKGQRFFYAHKLLLHRYMVDRHTIKLSDLEPLDRERRRQTFESAYHIDRSDATIREHFGKFKSSKPECRLSRGQVSRLERLENDIDRERPAKSLELFSAKLENNFHNLGHMLISEACSTGARSEHIMWQSVHSARDPIFYRWHYAIELKYVAFLEKKGPYTARDVRPARGIQVDGFELKDRCGKTEQLTTYWEIENTNNRSFYNIKHDQFKMVIRLKNEGRSRKRIIIRIFIGLEEFVGTGKWMIELDKFAHQLNGNPLETIERDEKESTFTHTNHPMQIWECGWPQNLFIPAGTTNTPRKFRFVAFVHDLEDQNTNEGMPGVDYNVLCGVNFTTHRGNLIVDKRDLGFPFNQGWPREVNLEQVVNNRNPDFGNVSTEIGILMEGSDYPGKQCNERPRPSTTTLRPSTSVTSVVTNQTLRPSPSVTTAVTSQTQRPSPSVTTVVTSQTLRPSPSVTTVETVQTLRPSPSVTLRTTTSAYTVETGQLGPMKCFGKFCYRVARNPRVTWYDAKRICKRYGLQLVKCDRRRQFKQMMRYQRRRNKRREIYWVDRRYFRRRGGLRCKVVTVEGYHYAYCRPNQRVLRHIQSVICEKTTNPRC